MVEKIQICMDCGRPDVRGGRGLCPNDYAKRRRRGTLPPKKGGPDAICAAPDYGEPWCGEKVGHSGAKGLCPKHYQRLAKGKAPGITLSMRKAPLEVRFNAMVSPEPCQCGCDGCLLWIGGINPDTGYANFSIGNKTHLAHRVAWELERGPIPDGFNLDHVRARGCRHRHCVKLEHLEPVTQAVNNQRMPMTEERRAGLSEAGRKGAAVRRARIQTGEATTGHENGYRVVAFVATHPDGVRARQVSDELGLSIHSSRQILARLAKRGLIKGNGSGLYQPI